MNKPKFTPYLDNLTEAMKLLMEYPSTIFIGQQIVYYGNPMSKTIEGLQKERMIETPVMEVLELIKEIEGNDNPIEFVNNKAPMIPTRLLSNEKLRKLGWEPKYDLRSGLEDALKWYKENKDQFDPNSKP